ncbi:oligosaccharide flippase family protein [Vibrio crassostreae]|uniref:oligosaccharide flippase family protein n=1 Tax=Vibrio crassostreae TaxID=246167 RepID=UPI000F463A9A|nr:oligosaccharide flippase family protein [Vibrio crassostreae]ROS65583.1 exopolysaccharide (amylovoran) exporter [Vibrio crassostreae]RPF12604.1 exopolysaccharide (amylovoran) exporter [Vibrio crassostreae]TCT39781.1 exopolysaccharide (amylovoran) exporter [Vibrio crassostreae]TCV60205.1 exopolysaccharide (amylovoran) exporter [Vibrio crassostreae]
MLKNIIKWQALSSVFIFVLAIIQVAALSRLLTLSDFGVVAIVMVVINVTQVLSDLGMSNYLVYKQKISDTLNSTVFWVCFFSGLSLFIFLVAISPLIAIFYSNDSVIFLLSLAAVGFIPISLASQMQARYICSFRLNDIAKYDVISKLIGTLVAIVTAYKDFGASSIIYGSLASSVIRCIFIWLGANREWWPKFTFSFNNAKCAWQYGMFQVGSQSINQIRGNLDTLLLGFYIDQSALGAYSLAKQLIQKPASFILPIVHKVSLPLLASIQSNVKELRSLVNKAHSYVAITLVLPYVLLGLLDETIVTIMYGIDNIQVSEYIIPLSIFWASRSIGGALVGALTQGLGKTKVDFYWNLSVSFLFSIVCILLAPYGAYFVSWGLAGLQLVLLNLVYLVFYKRIVSLNYTSFIIPIVKATMVSLLSSFFAMVLASIFVFSDSYYSYFIVVVTMSSLIYFVGCSIVYSDLIKLPNKFKLFKI